MRVLSAKEVNEVSGGVWWMLAWLVARQAGITCARTPACQAAVAAAGTAAAQGALGYYEGRYGL